MCVKPAIAETYEHKAYLEETKYLISFGKVDCSRCCLRGCMTIVDLNVSSQKQKGAKLYILSHIEGLPVLQYFESLLTGR